MTERHPAPQCTNMQQVRSAIDSIDRDMVRLIAERLGYVAAAARIKESRDSVRDEARIADVLSKVAAEAQAQGIAPEFVTTLYRQMIEASIAHELALFDARAQRQDASAQG